MRLGTVIGRVTLSVTVPSLEGARWLIVSPFTREHFQQGTETPPGMSKDPSLVVY
ncbi:MAG TPA: EutN/CcmL family microcompartment protein, partial [Clostridia bacterium]|nr:EutN/CcmL family microcompartment protein [Clostridia bacterium]